MVVSRSHVTLLTTSPSILLPRPIPPPLSSTSSEALSDPSEQIVKREGVKAGLRTATPVSRTTAAVIALADPLQPTSTTDPTAISNMPVGQTSPTASSELQPDAAPMATQNMLSLGAYVVLLCLDSLLPPTGIREANDATNWLIEHFDLIRSALQHRASGDMADLTDLPPLIPAGPLHGGAARMSTGGAMSRARQLAGTYRPNFLPQSWAQTIVPSQHPNDSPGVQHQTTHTSESDEEMPPLEPNPNVPSASRAGVRSRVYVSSTDTDDDDDLPPPLESISNRGITHPNATHDAGPRSAQPPSLDELLDPRNVIPGFENSKSHPPYVAHHSESIDFRPLCSGSWRAAVI